MMRLEWKVFISSKPCRLIVVPRQEFIKHTFGKLLFFFVFPKLGISYKVKKAAFLFSRVGIEKRRVCIVFSFHLFFLNAVCW